MRLPPSKFSPIKNQEKTYIDTLQQYSEGETDEEIQKLKPSLEVTPVEGEPVLAKQKFKIKPVMNASEYLPAKKKIKKKVSARGPSKGLNPSQST